MHVRAARQLFFRGETCDLVSGAQMSRSELCPVTTVTGVTIRETELLRGCVQLPGPQSDESAVPQRVGRMGAG